MTEIADVVSSETATTEWANLIRDRTIQRYADAAERASEHSSPEDGDLSFLASTGDIDVYAAGAWRHVNGPPVGSYLDHAGGSVPPGYLVCDGSAVSRTTYAGLFAQIGVIHGDGDGSTTFNLPDRRGRVSRGVAVSGTGDAVGEKFGADTHTHTGPSHSHSNPTTASDNHSHGFADTTTAQGTHDHGNTGAASGTAEFGAGSGFLAASGGHVHVTSSNGSHIHSVNGTTGSDSHSHTQGNTGAGGTGNTGSGSTIQAGIAVNVLIRT